MIGLNKEDFLELYSQGITKFSEFNKAIAELGHKPYSERTFQRRISAWVRDGEPFTPKDEQEDERPVAGGTVHAPDKERDVLKGRRFVFTSAQNNTFVHEEFWNNLLYFCDHVDAQLVVGRFTYNKSGFQNNTKDNKDLWYDPKLTQYLLDESLVLEDTHDSLVWCGELDIVPTATNPISALDSYTKTASGIIPHAKVQLKSVPVLKGDSIKMMYTTGACTQRNYIQRKAGQKAAFHHVFGALFVEIDDDGDFFARQLIADDTGSFHDLTEYFTEGSVQSGDVEAINWGDIHAEMLDPDVEYSGWRGDDCMLDTLTPTYQFVHDLTDFKARNHHNIRNPHFLAERHYEGDGDVEYGMEQAAALLVNLERDWCETIVVESNHDQAFRRWLAEADIRTDPLNAEYFHISNAEVFKRIRQGEPTFHIFEWAVRRFVELETTVFLDEDDSFVICGANGIECGMHGHRGPNGSRGNPNALRNLGRKCNVGHTHSAAIMDGIYVAGISCSMDMGYNKGPSSWSQSHIVTYPNGKRQIITMKNGKWRA